MEQIGNNAVWLISFQKCRKIIIIDAAFEGANRTINRTINTITDNANKQRALTSCIQT